MSFHFSVPKTLQSVYSTNKSNYYTDPDKDICEAIQNKDILSNSFSDKETYYVSNKTISESEWETISKYLRNSPFIKSLHFSGISLNEKGITTIAEIIIQNPKIKSLHLEWNFLNELIKEFSLLCDAISNSNIQFLSLNNNKISSIHMEGLLRLIKSKSLISINLKWNEIGNDTIRALIEYLKSNSCIQEININGNRVGSELQQELQEVLTKNQKSKYNSIVENNNYSSTTRINNFRNSNHNLEEFKNSQSCFYQSKPNLFQKSYSSYSNFQRVEHNNNEHFNTYKPTTSAEAIGEEYKARYDNQLLFNLNQDKQLTELEIEIKNQRTKYNEMKDNLTYELENERNEKAIYEDELNQLKEALLKKDLEYNQLVSNYEDQLRENLIEKQDYQNENSLLKDKITGLNLINEENTRNTKIHYEGIIEKMNVNLHNLKEDLDRLRNEMQDNINVLTKDYEKKLKILESTNSEITWENNQQSSEITLLKKEINEMKLIKNIESQNFERSIREEESKKLNSTIKEFEMKIMSVTNHVDETNKKNLFLNEELSKLRSEMLENESNYELRIQKLNKEKEELANDLSSLKKENNILQSQYRTKDNLVQVRKLLLFNHLIIIIV